MWGCLRLEPFSWLLSSGTVVAKDASSVNEARIELVRFCSMLDFTKDNRESLKNIFVSSSFKVIVGPFGLFSKKRKKRNGEVLYLASLVEKTFRILQTEIATFKH